MIEQAIQLVTHFIITTIDNTGYSGIFILMAAESALIPIPSEITMPFSGYLAQIGRFNIYSVILVGAFANLIGSMIAYGLGYWAEEHLLRTLIKKFGRFLLLSEHEYDRSERWFRKYGEKIVFYSRLLPVVRTFISLPAGIAEMNFWKFTYLTFLGSLIWSAFLTYLGYYLGKNWHSIEIYYRRFEIFIIIIIVVVGIYYLYKKLKHLKG